VSILRPRDFYHFGHVVDDLDAAARHLTALTGARWTTPVEFEMGLRYGDVEREVEFVAIYSLDAPHHELIQATPGTPFATPPGGGVHHLGYWAQDFATDLERLRDLGLTEEVVGLDDDGKPWGFAYFTGPAGGRVEIADRSTFDDGWEGFLASRVA
jgi:hypothetical protein